MIHVQIVDPSAYTPPYDRCLGAALARAGADVELVTSRFLYGPVPPADGYRVSEAFYRRSAERGLDAPGRRAFKFAEHVADMVRFRRGAGADVVHYQWLTMPALDWALVPGPALSGGRGRRKRAPQVFTFHERPARGRAGIAREKRVLSRMDAVVAHSEHAARRVRDELGFDRRVEVIPHGAFDYLTELPGEAPLPDELAAVERPIVLCFGLVRPYKGIDVLLEAFRLVPDAELWIVGNPRMPMEPLHELARPLGDRVRFVSRFVPDTEVAAYFRRASVVVLPHLNAEQSGVLHIALAFGKPMVLSAVGGFGEVAERDGAALTVPAGDPAALATTLTGLLGDEAERRRLSEAATAAAAGRYSWDEIGSRTLELYRALLG